MPLKRLRWLETRLGMSEDLHNEYNATIQDYLDSGHIMTKVQLVPNEVDLFYCTPHKAVVKPESTTTKIRVENDASAVTTSRMSMNDNLYLGSKLQ